MMESAAQAPPGVSRARAANDNADAPWPIVTFSPAELAQLVRTKVLNPSRLSPIASLLRSHPRAVLEARAAAASLAEKGLLRQAAHEPASELGAYLLLSLKAIARPQARLVVARYTPGGEPSILPLFLSGELVVPAFLDEGGLHVGTPMEKCVLGDTLEAQLAGDDASPGRDRFLLSTSVLETLEGLWCGAGRSYAEPIPKELAQEILAHLPDPQDDPDGLIEEMIASGVAIEGEDGLRFSAEAKPWMERVLSGHSCEVSYLPLQETPGQPGRSLRLLFLGPTGRRILCTGAYGLDDLEALLAHGPDRAVVAGPWTSPPPGAEDPTLCLSVLQRPVLRWYLRRLIFA
ncbi:MAG: hypothetical protein KDD47_18555 [Acidobacteria bacterium]|nr:hypothetical protein [Acidobacteriota bacterium]